MERTALYTAVQLVLRLSNQPNHRYTINLYEGYADSSNTLDSLIVSSGDNQEWLELTVHKAGPEEWNPQPKDNYLLTLEVTSSQGDAVLDDEAAAFLSSVSPRLVMYTYDNQTMTLEQLVMEARAKREALGSAHCGKHTWSTTWQQLGWPGADKKVIFPPGNAAQWTFCEGHCNQPLAGETTDQYTPHARILQSLKIHNNALVPDGGCAPATLSKHHILCSSKISRQVSRIDYFVVETCTCQ